MTEQRRQYLSLARNTKQGLVLRNKTSKDKKKLLKISTRLLPFLVNVGSLFSLTSTLFFSYLSNSFFFNLFDLHVLASPPESERHGSFMLFLFIYLLISCVCSCSWLLASPKFKKAVMLHYYLLTYMTLRNYII